MEEIVHNYGDVVACDFCNYGEESKGGVLIGSYAVCGDCSEKRGYYKDETNGDVDLIFDLETEAGENDTIVKKAEDETNAEIDLVFDNSKTFKQNVLDHRKKEHGSSNLVMTFRSFK